ncbi:hypothetical protein Taro_040540, partial [Colocasia esculenta]|nr:hypothetical protein [Colocasia esculenta]
MMAGFVVSGCSRLLCWAKPPRYNVYLLTCGISDQ